MSDDLDKALNFIRKEIWASKACAEDAETDEVVKQYRRVEVMLIAAKNKDDRIATLEAERDAAQARADALAEKLERAVEATTAALDNIDALNTLPPDENGHQWRASDLLDQEVMHLRATLAQIKGGKTDG